MTNKTTRRTIRALMLGSATFAITGFAAFADDVMKIGGVVSFSGSGASLGAVYDAGWKLAISDINAAGGILGRQVELVFGDTQSDPTHAVAELRRLIDNEGIEALLGSVVSQETIPMTTTTTEANMVQVSASASTTLTPDAAPYHFSTSPTGLDQMKANVDYAIDNLGLSKLALISDNGGMSKAAVTEIIAYMEERGAPPVIVQEFAYKAEDMTPQIFSMRKAGADGVLIINSIGDDSRKFLENRLDIGWMVPVLGNLTMGNFAVSNAEIAGAEAFEDVYSTQYVGLTFCPGEDVSDTPFARMRENAIATIPELARMGGAEALVSAYTMGEMLAKAINGAGTTDGDAVKAWIEGAGEIETVAGPFMATATQHFFPVAETMRVIRNPHVRRDDGLKERAICES